MLLNTAADIDVENYVNPVFEHPFLSFVFVSSEENIDILMDNTSEVTVNFDSSVNLSL